MKQSRRISPRIPYDEAVSLARVDGGGRLFGRSVNLSTAGMYIRCAEPCEIGTELVCSVLLPGGPRKLRGRVVRIMALARGVGMAIAFGDITERDRVTIEQLIADHQREVFQAKLRLGGMDRPVRCEAVFDARTVHLSTTLPFLRLDADVGVMLGDSEEVQAQGVIRKIALDPACDDGVPRLALDVDLAGAHGGELDVEDDTPSPLPVPPPRAGGEPLPSVVISKALEHEVVAHAVLNGPPRRRSRGTAEIARRPRFTDWTLPPTVTATPAPIRLAPRTRTQRLLRARARAWRWRYLLVLPLAAVITALALLIHASGV